MNWFTLALVGLLLLQPSCNSVDDPAWYPADISRVARPVSWSSQLKELVQRKCVKCHSRERIGDQRFNAPDEINFDSYADMLRWAAASNSSVIHLRMPPPTGRAGMIDVDRALFGLWIVDGKLR